MSLSTKLDDKDYRDHLVSGYIHTALAFQIRAIREQRGWTQRELGRRIGRQQPGISPLETPGHAYSLRTLEKLASAFDVALVVRFVPFSDLTRWADSLEPGSLQVPSFEEERAKERVSLPQVILIAGQHTHQIQSTPSNLVSTAIALSAPPPRSRTTYMPGQRRV